MEVVMAHAKEADRKRISGALLGGLTRKMMVADEYIGLPTAVNVLDGSGDVVTEPEKVKEVTQNYFQGLYHHNDPPDLPKPWMQSPSVIEVKDRVARDPFVWPKLVNVNDFRAMIRCSNHRPAPARWMGKMANQEPFRQYVESGHGPSQLHHYALAISR